MPTPAVSVVLPVYNDPHGAQLTLASVLNQTYPADDYEIVAVDNNSDAIADDAGLDTASAIAMHHEWHPDRVRPVFEGEQGLWHALNAGIDAARGDVFAFIDAGMTVEVDWLESVVETLESGDHDYMGCRVETYPPGGRETPATLFDRLTLFRMAEYLAESNFVGSGCLTVRREVIDAVGGFDPRSAAAADKEFGKRVHAAGFSQHFEPSIEMHHPARATAREHWRKNVKVGRGGQQLARHYPDLFGAPRSPRVRDFLPPHPRRFVARLRDRMVERDIDADRSLQEWAGLYAFGCVQKYGRSVGSLAEYLTHRAPG